MAAKKEAARITDVCTHTNFIVSGSPNTTTESQKQARLEDRVSPCPVCKTVGGEIVSSSKTVFVNAKGAARVTDKVQCSSAVPKPGPQAVAELAAKVAKEKLLAEALDLIAGSGPSAAQQYNPRDPEDHYHRMMEVEHEASEWDEIEAYEREKLAGRRAKTTVPVGIPPGQSGGAARKPQGLNKRPKKAAGPHEDDDEDSNLFRPKEKRKKPASPKSSAAMKKGSASSVGKLSKGSSFGGGGEGSDKSSDYEDEDKRDDAVVLDLEFPIDLELGARKGKKGTGSASNQIKIAARTVFIGD